MKVAYLLPPLKRSDGWRNHALGLIHEIRRYVEPVLFVAVDDYETAKVLFQGDQLITLPTIQNAFLQASHLSKLVLSLKAISSRCFPNVDLVHALVAYPAGFIGYWLASKLKKPLVLTAHGTYSVLPYNYFLDKIAYERVLRYATAMCPVSTSTANLVKKYFPGATANLYIKPILNGNHYYKTIPRHEAVHRRPSAVPTILSVGAVKPRKGYHVSLQAFARLKESVPAARYWIVGDIDKKNYYQKLLQFITTHQLKDVEFFGAVPDEKLRQCYREASVFVLAAQQEKLHFEGFGLAFLEAGAFGLPVVGTRSGGISDAIRNEETGFIVDPDDIQGIADALKRLLTDAELARQIGLANREWAETLTWERYAREQYQVYQDIL